MCSTHIIFKTNIFLFKFILVISISVVMCIGYESGPCRSEDETSVKDEEYGLLEEANFGEE